MSKYRGLACDIYGNIYIAMKRTTIYLDADTDVLLKLEAMRSGRSAAESSAKHPSLRAGRPCKPPPWRGHIPKRPQNDR